MNKKILLILLLISSFFSYSQHTKGLKKTEHLRTVYMKIKDYKNKYKKQLTKTDSLNFKIINNDTLIKVTNYKSPKGVPVDYEFKDSLFLNYYKKIAFNHKNDSVSSKTKMIYWKKPIKIYFSKSIKGKTKKSFLKFTSYLSKNIDSLNISEVRKVENSNYIIYYKGDFEYESRMYNYKNTDYYMYWNGNNQIYKCALKIDSENNFNEKLRLYNMKDYFFRSLGNFKLSNEFKCESFFSNCYSNQKRITNFDLALIKYHYSYGICKGTDLKTFEEHHKKAKKIMKKKNHKMQFFHTY